METRCPFPDCLTVFSLPLPGDELKPTRPVTGCCPNCGRRASFKPLSVLLKLERQVGNQSEHYTPEPVPLTVLVEDVRSLWNVGSIFRSADGAGWTRLILSGITGCPPRKEIAKTSLGAEDHLLWKYYLSAVDVLPQLKSAGVLIVGLERNLDSIDLSKAVADGRLRTPLCLVVGNEVTGLSAESLDLCDVVCHLPMRGFKESLNVAVAYGIASYTLASAFLPDSVETEKRGSVSQTH